MKKAILLPFKRVVALDGSEWMAAWGLENTDISFASAFIGCELVKGERAGTVQISDPKFGQTYSFEVYDCGSHFWAETDMSNGIWAQAVRAKSTGTRRSLVGTMLSWLRNK